MKRSPTSSNPGPIVAIAPTTSNKVNSQGGQVGPTPNQQAGTLATTIPANTTLPFSVQGSFFYMQACSGGVRIRPNGGSFNVYAPGTGYVLPKQPAVDAAGNPVTIDGSFSLLEIQNTNDYPVSLAVFIGFGAYIDNRLILQQGVVFPIAYPTSPQANVSALIAIPDLSGNAFADLNGTNWLALQRIAIFISNVDPATSLVLQASSPVVGVGVLVIPPNTTMQFAASGNFSLKIGAGTVNAIVSELYNAIAPNIPL